MFLVAVSFACVGCGGGGGGSSSGGSTPSYLTVPTLSATVPAGGGGSVRGSVNAASANEFAVALVNPETGETIKSITATSITPSGANQVINFGSNITVAAPSKGVLKMVVTRLSVAILRGYISSAVPEAGETKTTPAVDIGSDDLAKALAFEEWQTQYSNGTFDSFINQVENESSFGQKLTTLVTTIETTLVTLITSSPSETFTWEAVSDVKAIADDFKEVAAPPTTGGVGIPANIQVEGLVASPATQVRCAIESILNLANIGLPSRIVGSVAPSTSAVPVVPALTPILGSNQAIDIKGLRNLLMASLPGGTSATEGPIADLSSPTSSISFTSNSVEIIDKRVSWIQGSGFVTQNTNRKLMEGVEVTTSNGVISQIKFNANSKFTNETLNPTTGVVENRVVFQVTSGLSGTASYQKEASEGFYALYSATSGVAYTYRGLQKLEATISGTIVADVTANDVVNNVTAGGRVTVSGVSGTISESRPFYYGKFGWKQGETFYPQTQNDFFFISEEEEMSDSIAFSGNALSISVTAESTAKDIYLKQLSLNLTGISKITTGEYEGEYKVGGISGAVLASYNGTNYKDYGYIKQLEITIANASFDPSATQQVPDGATVTLKKTNSDNTVDTLTYTMTNGKPVLSGSTNFQGGDTTVTTTDGNVKYTGTITFQDPTAKKMVMNYEAVRVYDSPLLLATATMTIDSTTTRKITYTYNSTPTHLTSGITDGLYKDGSGNLLGHFTWKLFDPNNFQNVNMVLSTDIQGWENFLLGR
ncbi:hypothetical protein KBA41_01995 [Candidatus Ozemobacteraceae bacterium]|nr:hypothetical protein [Candidatus Ozemobacteraceae bacterium]